MLAGPNLYPGDTDKVYIDVDKFNNLLSDLNTTASVLNIDDDVFSNADSANGTEAMAELIKELGEVQNVSNYYKKHISDGVVLLLENVRDNIKKTSKITGDSIKHTSK